jgi:hypothetical protein
VAPVLAAPVRNSVLVFDFPETSLIYGIICIFQRSLKYDVPLIQYLGKIILPLYQPVDYNVLNATGLVLEIGNTD